MQSKAINDKVDPEELKERRLNGRRDVVVVGLRDECDRVLMVKTSRLPRKWQPIGGGMDPGDGTPIDALIREVQEEVGIRLSADRFRLVTVTPYDFGEGTVYFYEAAISEEAEALQFNRREIVEHTWVTVGEARELEVFPATRTFLSKLD